MTIRIPPFVSLLLLAGWCLSPLNSLAQETVVDPAAQETRGQLIVIVGTGGEGEYAALFDEWASEWVHSAERGEFQSTLIPPSAEDSTAQPQLERFQESMRLAVNEATQPLWIVLIGHGTFDGRSAKFNLAGPDLTADELQQMIAPLKRPVAVINCSAASAPYLQPLSAPDRVIITATRTGNQVNFSRFGGFLAKAVGDLNADLDKDGQVSLLEAFLKASQLTDEYYKSDGRLATENALIDDNGDGKGTRQNAFRGVRVVAEAAQPGALLDGVRAHQWHLIENDFDKLLSPEAIARRNELELQLEQLRAQKADFSAVEYDNQLEQILLQLAEIALSVEPPAEESTD